MLNIQSLLKVFLLVQLATLVQSEKCGFWINLKSSYECKEYMYEESRYELPEDATRRDFHRFDSFCQDAITCFSQYDCDEVQQEKDRINAACDLVYYQRSPLRECLIDFFKGAYVAELTDDDTSCFWKYHILDYKPARNSKEYDNRKECFMNHVSETCYWDAQDYFNTYPESYERFSRYMASRVANNNCTDPQSFLNSFHCSAMIEELQSWSWEVDREPQSKKYNVAHTKKICRDVERCVATSCVENETDEKCLSSFDCEEIRNMGNQINSTCEILLLSDKDVISCLKGFFSSVFIFKFSDKKSCLSDFFLDNDMNKRLTAFTSGKSCFDEFITTHCSSRVSKYFTDNAYQKLTKFISTKPIGKDCTNSQNVLDDIYCKALVEELDSQLDKKTGNKTAETIFNALCEHTVKCAKNSCSMHEDWRLRNDLAYICNTPLPLIEE